MSVRLMAEIFETEFRDLKDQEGNTTKASTAKFICIALADHANDEGEGAYPSLAKIAYKTSLSRTCVINAMDALKYNGIAIVAGTSKWDTVNYTINRACFSQIEGSKSRVLVNPVDSHQLTQLTPPVNPVDPNHTITIHKPPSGAYAPQTIEGAIFADKPVTEAMLDNKTARMIDASNLIDMQCNGAGALALAFMQERGIVFTNDQVKGQRKAARELLAHGVKPENVRAAVVSLVEKRMTVTDLYSVSKTAIDLANEPETKRSGRSFGL